MEKEKSCLMKMCTENVYHDNVFHLLGLRTTATPRQIRRRGDDFESAKMLGEGSWKDEFKYLMGNRPIPSVNEIEEAFNRLEDPEYRIISEFFWGWPLEDDDHALNELLDGRRGKAIDIWEKEVLGFGKRRIVAQHNLAVVYQFYAIDAELQALNDGEGYIPDEFRPKISSYWEKSFAYWEKLVDDDEFWEIYETRMREFDDPRLTGGFIRRFRAEFPIAFDNINAQLAMRYAKLARFYDAKRHVDYMSRTMKGLDDVQENMNIIFTPMEQRMDLLVNGYDELVKADPKKGLECAKKFLKESKAILRVATTLLNKNERTRTDLFTRVVTTCSHYLIVYGNKTSDWESCIKPLEGLLEIACTQESKSFLEKNIRIARANIEQDKLQNTCWVCNVNKADSKYSLRMYGDVTREWGRVKWRYGTFDVPVCKQCLREKEAASEKQAKIVVSAVLLLTFLIIVGYCLDSGTFIIWSIISIFVGALMCLANLGGDGGFDLRCKEYPPIKELICKGWEFGEKPPTN